MTNTTRLAADKCPHCGELIDVTTPSPGNPHAVPEPGDMSVCVTCAESVVFGDGLKLRKPNMDEQLWIANNFHMQLVLTTIRGIIARRPKQ